MPRLTGTSATTSTGTGSSRQRTVGPPQPRPHWEHYVLSEVARDITERAAEYNPTNGSTETVTANDINLPIMDEYATAESQETHIR